MQTYLVSTLSLDVIHRQRLLMALDVGGLHDAIVGAKFAFRTRIKKRHVLEGATAHKNARLTGDRTPLRLD